MASWALPCFNIWCPGKTERKVSSSGAPRNTDGIKSRKVWVIAIDVINTTKAITGIKSNAVRLDIKITAIKFMWIPGIRPVNVPMRHPSNKARISSIIILL